MPRQARVTIPEVAHHITQRGNNRQVIFEEADDFKKYITWLSEYSAKYRFTIHSYCLMNNHVHFVGVPEEEETLARVFNTLHMRYAQYFNWKKKTSGHVWQGRFYSCVLDDEHLYRAIRYVERNPVRAQVVGKAWEYKWSSAGWHVGIEQESPVKVGNIHNYSGKEWEEYLMEEDHGIMDEIKGTAPFID